MATLSQTSAHTFETSTSNWLTSYKNFVAKSEFTRIGWAATFVTIQGCILTPALLLTMFYLGGSDWQLLIGNLSFLLVLVPILSAMPLKYIFPAFGISTVIHLVLIASNLL